MGRSGDRCALGYEWALCADVRLGFVRLQDFFLRMHPPALATIGKWCVALAATLYFSWLAGRPTLHPLLIPVFLAVTVPVTTVLLARASLFRRRNAGGDAPIALAPKREMDKALRANDVGTS